MMRIALDEQKVSKRMNELGWDEKKLASEMGVSRTQVYRVLRKMREPGNEFIAGVLHVFEVTDVNQFFKIIKKAGGEESDAVGCRVESKPNRSGSR